jgi:hypothetical protein
MTGHLIRVGGPPPHHCNPPTRYPWRRNLTHGAIWHCDTCNTNWIATSNGWTYTPPLPPTPDTPENPPNTTPNTTLR